MRAILVDVDEHEALPDGCCMRFSAIGEERVVRGVWVDGAECALAGFDEDDREVAAKAVLVDDSSGGQSLLLHGGAHGLRVTAPDGSVSAEPYLLVAPGEEIA